MTRNRLLLLVIGLTLVASAPLLRAHHSEAAEFDSTKMVMVTGTLVRLEWQNPHVWFYVDVKDADGKVTTWGFSTAPPGSLIRRGIVKANFKIGETVNVSGARARDGSPNASTRSVTFADGRNVMTPLEGGR